MFSNEEGKVFPQAWLKIQRAYQHVQEVEARFDAYRNSNFWRVYIEPYEQGAALVTQVTKKPDLEISLATGDAIHNLRAALDYVTSVFAQGL